MRTTDATRARRDGTGVRPGLTRPGLAGSVAGHLFTLGLPPLIAAALAAAPAPETATPRAGGVLGRLHLRPLRPTAARVAR